MSLVSAGRPRVEELNYTVREAAKALRIGKDAVYDLIRAGKLRTIVFGKRSRRVPRREVEAYQERLLKEQNPPERGAA